MSIHSPGFYDGKPVTMQLMTEFAESKSCPRTNNLFGCFIKVQNAPKIPKAEDKPKKDVSKKSPEKTTKPSRIKQSTRNKRDEAKTDQTQQ